MKRLFIGLTLLFSTLVLTGCDEFFRQNETNLWFDESTQELHVTFDLKEPSANEETGEVEEETIHLLVLNHDTSEWEEVYQFSSYQVEDEVIPFNYNMYGDIYFKIITQNQLGEFTFESPEFHIWINEPQFIYHFDTYFDTWSGKVQFNFGVNEFMTDKLVVEKSSDGGLTWIEIISTELMVDEHGGFKNQLSYYEFEEGNYVYRLNAYDELGELVDQMNTWEINVYFETKNYEGTPEIRYVGANYETYAGSVHIWWDAQGDFSGFIVEKSMDMETWELLTELPRMAQSFSYQEDVDGYYYYRVSAVNETVLHSMMTQESIRVKEDAVLGGFQGYVEWDTNNINLNWQFFSERVESVVLERKLDDGFYEVVGEFGPLKMMHIDEGLVPGSYIYRVSVLDEDGIVLDQLESMEFKVLRPEHVYHINAWHNSSTGEVEFNFGFNHNFVTNYVIEKSVDGGLTWEEFLSNSVEYTEYDWYKDNTRAYEFVEGVYTYRILGYDDEGNEMGSATSYQEVVVQYSHLNFNEPIQMYYIDGHFNIYDESVSLWWDGQGNHTSHVIEYSFDQETWVFYKEVPRVTNTVSIRDIPNGEYYFRVSAVNSEGVQSFIETQYTIHVRENAYIGNFHGYYDWNNQVTLYWDIIKEDVEIIRVERKLLTDETYSDSFEFGPFKTTFLDTVPAGEYVYRLTLLDENGEVLDQMESYTITVYTE